MPRLLALSGVQGEFLENLEEEPLPGYSGVGPAGLLPIWLPRGCWRKNGVSLRKVLWWHGSYCPCQLDFISTPPPVVGGSPEQQSSSPCCLLRMTNVYSPAFNPQCLSVGLGQQQGRSRSYREAGEHRDTEHNARLFTLSKMPWLVCSNQSQWIRFRRHYCGVFQSTAAQWATSSKSGSLQLRINWMRGSLIHAMSRSCHKD